MIAVWLIKQNENFNWNANEQNFYWKESITGEFIQL